MGRTYSQRQTAPSKFWKPAIRSAPRRSTGRTASRRTKARRHTEIAKLVWLVTTDRNPRETERSMMTTAILTRPETVAVHRYVISDEQLEAAAEESALSFTYVC